MKQEIIEHKDKLGRPLSIGDVVAYPDNNFLEIGSIKKLTPKMLIVFQLGKTNRYYKGSRKYPSEVIKIETSDLTLYLLKLKTYA